MLTTTWKGLLGTLTQRISVPIASDGTVKAIVSNYKKSMPQGATLGRISEKSYLLDGSGKFSPAKACVGRDNSGTVNRYSGGGYLNAQAGLYLATKGKNGLFSTVTSESAFYTDKAEYRQLQGTKESTGAIPVVELRKYFDPAVILPPSKVVVAYTAPELQFWNSVDGLHDLEAAIRHHLVDLMDFLRQVHASAPQDIKEEMLSPDAIREILGKPAGAPLSLQTALRLPIYTVSSAVGNACLSEGIGVVFPSVRADVMSGPEYMEGGYNVVTPMADGQPTGLDVSRIYSFDPSDRRLKSQTVDEYNA